MLFLSLPSHPLILLMLAGILSADSAAVKKEDEEHDRVARIVNGKPVPPGIAKWQVSIQRKMYINNIATLPHFCGGSLLDKEWVLTAGHCMNEVTPGMIRVGVGSNNLNQLTYYNVKKIYRHEDFDIKTLNHDIALIQLDKRGVPDIRAAGAEAVPLEDRSDFVSDKCYVTGFGRLSEGGPRTETMEEAQVPLYTDMECRAAFPISYIITNAHCCAGGGKSDACQGDSGGPLTCCSGDLDATANTCRLVGITSWGIGCATEGRPGVYTKVAAYKGWIKAKMEGKDYDEKSSTGWRLMKQLHTYFSSVLPFKDDQVFEEDVVRK